MSRPGGIPSTSKHICELPTNTAYCFLDTEILRTILFVNFYSKNACINNILFGSPLHRSNDKSSCCNSVTPTNSSLKYVYGNFIFLLFQKVTTNRPIEVENNATIDKNHSACTILLVLFFIFLSAQKIALDCATHLIQQLSCCFTY